MCHNKGSGKIRIRHPINEMRRGSLKPRDCFGTGITRSPLSVQVRVLCLPKTPSVLFKDCLLVHVTNVASLSSTGPWQYTPCWQSLADTCRSIFRTLRGYYCPQICPKFLRRERAFIWTAGNWNDPGYYALTVAPIEFR